MENLPPDGQSHSTDSTGDILSAEKPVKVPTDDNSTPTSGGDSRPNLLSRLRGLLSTGRGKMLFAAIGLLISGGVVIGSTDIKYAVLGPVVKSRAEVTVIDSKTNQPIPKATVVLAGVSQETNNDGKVSFKGLQPGRTTLDVSKKAYRASTRAVKLTFRPPKFDPVALESSGIEVSFEVTDKISGQALDGVEIQVDKDTAISKNGRVLFSLLPRNPAKTTARLVKAGYLEASIDFEVRNAKEPYKVTMVPEGKVYFLSNRTGKIDLYESNLDGSALQVVLAGTGKENSETGILPNVTNPSLLAIVSSRDGRPGEYGGFVQDLFLFNTASRKLIKVEDNVPFGNFRGWLGDYLVYVKYPPGAYCAEIKSYQVSAAKTSILVAGDPSACPNLNLALNDLIFYSIKESTPDKNGLYAIRASGQSNRRLHDTPASNVARQTKQTLLAEYYNYSLPSGQKEVWHSINLSDFSVSKLSNAPARESIRGYIESPAGRYTTFIEERDGKSELYLADAAGSNERKLTELGSVNQFVQWIGDNYIVFSSTKSDENALYIISISGGKPQKIADFYRGNSRTYSGGYNPVY